MNWRRSCIDAGPKRGQVASDEDGQPGRLVEDVVACETGRGHHPLRPERPGATDRRVDVRPVVAERPPHAGPLADADPVIEPRLHVVRRARLGEVRGELGHERIGLRDRQPGALEARIVESSRPERALHRRVEGRVVARGDGVDRDPHQVPADHVVRGVGRVQVGRIEVGDACPQGEVWTDRILRLEGDDAVDRLDDVETLATEQELAGEGGPVEGPFGQTHGRHPTDRGGSRRVAKRKRAWRPLCCRQRGPTTALPRTARSLQTTA